MDERGSAGCGRRLCRSPAAAVAHFSQTCHQASRPAAALVDDRHLLSFKLQLQFAEVRDEAIGSSAEWSEWRSG